jgi:ABC-type Zn uptake system ZnuABC Zn-binding protein ZnuA
VDLTVLLRIGADPHGFTPTSREVAAVAGATVLFQNGLGLEALMAPVLRNAGAGTTLVTVSDGIQTLTLAAPEGAAAGAASAGATAASVVTAGSTAAAAEAPPTPAGAGPEVDPHVWMDPINVQVWTQNIERALTAADPAHAAGYAANAAAYHDQLDQLDAWIRTQVAAIPADRRLLVSDHQELAYFARRYGFEQVGTILESLSTLAEPSAASVAQLEDQIRRLGVPAIFVSTTVNPQLADRVGGDTGATVVPIYTGSLGPAGSGASTYLDMMRFDVNAFVQVLR